MFDPALERASDLLGRYRGRGVLLDANVLVVYVVASVDRRLVGRLKATKDYRGRDAALLSAIVASAGRLVTTPHVLTEVNGLLNIGGPDRHRVLGALAEVTGKAEEVYRAARRVSADSAFRRLGLTDAAILDLAAGGPLVVSADGDLCNELLSRGAGALHYNNRPPRP